MGAEKIYQLVFLITKNKLLSNSALSVSEKKEKIEQKEKKFMCGLESSKCQSPPSSMDVAV